MASKPDGRAQAPFSFSDQLDPTTTNMSSRSELVRRLHGEMAEEIVAQFTPLNQLPKVAFVAFVRNLLETVYATAVTVHLVLDNLNTHFRKSFVDVLGETAAAALLQRVQFHYTPKLASWLNMAEIGIGIMDRQCTGQRIATVELLQREIAQWQQQRNVAGRGIEWNSVAFTLYPPVTDRSCREERLAGWYE